MSEASSRVGGDASFARTPIRPRRNYMLPDPTELSIADLVGAVQEIQHTLWYVFNQGVDPDKEWTVETIEEVARSMVHHKLGPTR